MRLLVITQKMDRNDPILGFFHQWVERLAQCAESVTVICLFEGAHALPRNVRVLSLGKETHPSRFRYLRHFYTYIWRERKTYNSVFVHMNQEYVLLGGLLWRIWKKRVVFWRNHQMGSVLTRVAVSLANVVVCTSSSSYTAQFAKTRIVPVGVDTTFFSPDTTATPTPRSLLFLGRISEIKRPQLFVAALQILARQGVSFQADIVGDPVTPAGRALRDTLMHMASDKVCFLPAVPHHETRDYYRKHELYVNLTPPGSFDKTIIEAMATGALVMVANDDALREVSEETRRALVCASDDPQALATSIRSVLEASEHTKEVWRRELVHAAQAHSLDHLMQVLCDTLSAVRK